jgi:alkylation response protein AidB-like acyl-CoA dehydrogenase
MDEKVLSFSMSEEQNIMKETAAKLIKDNIIDSAHEIDESGEMNESTIQKFWDLGTAISGVPEEYGGYGMENSPIMNSIILEELAAGDMAYAIAATLPMLFINPINEMGTDEQKKKYLPIYCGEKYKPATLAINEPHFGFDAVELKATAVPKKNSYFLNGKKCFVPLADESGHILVAASVNGKNNFFIVNRDNPGLKISEREKNLGIYSLKTYTIDFDNCEISNDDILGGKEGCDYNKFLQQSRIAMSAIGTGLCRASFEYARDYSKERIQFGEAIANRQSVAFMIAEMAYEVDSMRLLTWKAASVLEAEKDAQRDSYLAKLYSGNMSMKITDFGVQVLGGHGYVRDHPVERYYRNGRGIAILEGMAIV